MTTIFSLLVIVLIGYLIFKKYNAQASLFFGGLLLLGAAIVTDNGVPLAEAKSSGSVMLDLFTFIKVTMSSTVAGLGLNIMAVAGFAKYMDHIGASQVLVKVTLKPLQKFQSPYIVMALGYLAGQMLNIFIPSAAGLGLLLMVTLYPVLTKLGVSKLSAVAVIATSACLDLGPASGNSVMAASNSGLEVTDYFMNYQFIVGGITAVVIAVMHFFVQRYYDTKGHGAEYSQEVDVDVKDKAAPIWYSLLPLVPLALIFTFSKMIMSSVKIDIPTAMFVSLTIAMVCEIARQGAKDTMSSILVFFDGMGNAFARVITLIVAGQVFASGLKTIGILETAINAATSASIPMAVLIILMVVVIALFSILMGSGNAPFFSFAALVPDIAAKVGVLPVAMLLPMQLGSGIARSMSPIAGVIIGVAGIAGVSPFDIVKRTAPVMIVALIVSTGTSILLTL
ncbi:C4-dicarboxylate transporter DcuC [uncultured Endozoicomonas sp.]|uniref:C4-dicarboxylate transporter DcuC n=1 Tax=uncultured Endozoicomonas sp. TaxID=432652 RepID=UPI00262F6C06|nr:C4-dicarboxylate transporter DcuC [uncultured Endozoicomonas sp.]